MKRKRLFLIATCVLAGCGSVPKTQMDAEYPGTLEVPEHLAPDFMVEQHIEAKRGDRGGSFDAVVQKQGDELVVIGLGPMKTRAFVLRQRGSRVTFEQSFGPKLPFPPRNIVVDVHRVFFKRLPLAEGSADGTYSQSLDGETVVEVWKNEMLRERRFMRPSEFPDAAVRIEYGEGCRRARCEPSHVRIVNEWFGYTLEIENTLFQPL